MIRRGWSNLLGFIFLDAFQKIRTCIRSLLISTLQSSSNLKDRTTEIEDAIASRNLETLNSKNVTDFCINSDAIIFLPGLRK